MKQSLICCYVLILMFGSWALWAVEPGKPSVTSLIVTCQRALLSRHPDPLLRNPDNLAEKFLGPEERDLIKDTPCAKALEMDAEKGMNLLMGRGLQVLVRTRHTDALFEESLRKGAKQVVILGAGLDSRAYRYRDRLRGIRIFEIDFPPTQEYKKKRVCEIFGVLPSSLSCNVRSHRLHQAGSGYRVGTGGLRHKEEDILHLGGRYDVHPARSCCRYFAVRREQIAG
jgi:hypothetical protein